MRFVSIAVGLVLALAACPGNRAAGPGTGTVDPVPDAAPLTDVPVAPAPLGRLGDVITPVAYRLDLMLDPADATYSGQVAIDVELHEAASSVWLHARDLTLGKVTLTRGDETLELSALATEPDGELIGFSFGKTLASGPATLELTFAAKYRKMDGTFVQPYEGRRYLYTDFEPIDARAALPCFDDPRFKTPWTVSLTIPDHLRGYSNAPLASEEAAPGGKKRLTFAATRPLPTYLVAYAVGPFDEVDAGSDPVPLRMLVPAGKAEWGEASAAMASSLLGIVAAYVDTDVPYEKIDLIAVPEFNGAMENPGLITVAARILLQDPDGAPIADQRLLALVHAHEYAHLWFGDLVTLDYWNELWLNEGFATWMADKALAAWRPERGTRNDEVIAKGDAMAVDSALAARAVRQPITSSQDIRDAFDAITYKKGGAVMAMLEAWVGASAFQRAVRTYLADHVDGTVTTADLTAAIEQASGKDVSAVIESFTDQNGIPLIEASVSCTEGASRVSLSQRRFLYAGNAQHAGAADTDRLWTVPVCMRYPTADGGTARVCAVLGDRAGTVDLPVDTCPAWVYPNAGADGYYRYDMPNDGLLELAGNAPLSEREMTELAAHTFELLRSGDIDAVLSLKLVDQLAPRAGRLAQVEMMKTVGFVADHLVEDEAHERKLAAYVDRVFGPQATALGLTPVAGESEDDTLLRPLVVGFAARHGGDKRLLRAVKKAATRYLSSGEGLSEEMVWPVLVGAARHGNAALFDDLVGAIEAVDSTATDAFERTDTLVTALGSFRDEALVDRALELAGDSRIGSRYVVTLMSALGDTTAKRQHVLEYLVDNLATLASNERGRYMLLGPLFDTPFCSAEHAAIMEQLLDAVVGNSDERLKAQLSAHLFSTAGNCAVVREANLDAVGGYFD